MDTVEFKIRNANHTDIQRMIFLEETVWRKENTDVYGEEHFRAWLETYPEGFLVAEHQGLVVALIYTEAISFDSETEFPWGTYNDVTDEGYTRRTHNPKGSHHFGLTICSIHKGAGAPLLQGLIEFSTHKNRPLLGVSRLPGLSDYLNCEAVRNSGINQDVLVQHYVLQTANKSGGRVRDRLSEGYKPNLCPDISKADPVLRYYIETDKFTLYQILPNFWKDPKSADFAVLFCQDPFPS